MTSKRKTRDAYMRARNRADRNLDRTALKPVGNAYNAETGRAVRELGRLFKGSTRELVDPSITKATIDYMTKWSREMGKTVGSSLEGATRVTLIEGFDSSSLLLKQLDGQSPLTAAQADLTVSRLMPEMLRFRAQSMSGTSNEIHARVVATTRRLLGDETARVSDLITDVGQQVDHEAWRVERLVRTETAYAYNQSSTDAVVLANEELPDRVYNRWTEYVDDITMTHPLDKRVGKDSLVLHGQIALPGKVFTMPPGSGFGKMDGRSWHHPPNRPNDRAVLCPWRKAWGVPAWIYQSGARVRV